MDDLIRSLLERAIDAAPVTVLALVILFSPTTAIVLGLVYWRSQRELSRWQERFFRNAESMERTNAAWIDFFDVYRVANGGGRASRDKRRGRPGIDPEPGG